MAEKPESKPAEKPPTHQPGDGIRSMRSTTLFRAVNFELYAKPVSILFECGYHALEVESGGENFSDNKLVFLFHRISLLWLSDAFVLLEHLVISHICVPNTKVKAIMRPFNQMGQKSLQKENPNGNS